MPAANRKSGKSAKASDAKKSSNGGPAKKGPGAGHQQPTIAPAATVKPQTELEKEILKIAKAASDKSWSKKVLNIHINMAAKNHGLKRDDVIALVAEKHDILISADSSPVTSRAGSPAQPGTSQPEGVQQAASSPPPRGPSNDNGAPDDGGDGDSDDDGGDDNGGSAEDGGFEFNALAESHAHSTAVMRELDAKTIAATQAKPSEKPSMAEVVAGAGTKKITIDPMMSAFFARVRAVPQYKNLVPPSEHTEMLFGTAGLAADGFKGYASYDLRTPFLSAESAIEAAQPGLKRAMLTAKSCMIVVRQAITKSTVVILNDVPSANAGVHLSDRRVRIFSITPSNPNVFTMKGTIVIKEATMRIVGPKKDVNAFATEAGVRWSYENAYERNGKTQMHVVGGLKADQIALAKKKDLLMIPDSCVTAGFKRENMLTIDFKHEVGPEQAYQFLLQLQRDNACLSTILMFRGRVLLPRAVTQDDITTLKDAHKDIITNVRCPALGRHKANRRPEAPATTADEDDTNALTQEQHETLSKSTQNSMIATKVAGGDASPWMTSNQADCLGEELKKIDKGVKKVGFTGSHALFVAPNKVMKALHLDDARASKENPQDLVMHFELGDGTVLALRPYKAFLAQFTEARARREQSLANATRDTSGSRA